MQSKLFSIISKKLSPTTSLNEAVAAALNLSYDAAHRRTAGKSKLSLEESLKLSAYFNVSIDALLENEQHNIVAVEKTKQIENNEDLEKYFEDSAISVGALSKLENVKLFYSAKDIPLFYTLKGDLLTRFKIYVWIKLLSPSNESVSFSNFKIPLKTLEAAKKLGNLYENIPKVEIWDTTTFNSTLKQIYFYYQAGLLEFETAQELCNDLTKLLINIKLSITNENKDFQLYHNELLLMNNTVFIRTPYTQAFYVPFTFLSYFLATDDSTCKQAEFYIEKQLSHSKLLNTAGERERNLFFEKLNTKVNALSQLIAANETLNFE